MHKHRPKIKSSLTIFLNNSTHRRCGKRIHFIETLTDYEMLEIHGVLFKLAEYRINSRTQIFARHPKKMHETFTISLNIGIFES